MIQAKNLQKQSKPPGGVRAVKDVSFEIARGEDLLRERVKGPASSKPADNNKTHSVAAQPAAVVQG